MTLRLGIHLSVLVLSTLTLASQVRAAASDPPPLRWWKGNLHTHTLWSDGDDYPEMIAEWYKTNGYHFLALSDHNVIQQDIRWIPVDGNRRGGGRVLEKYLARFGPAWVEQRVRDGTNEVRLKPLSEFRTRFEEPDRFMMFPAQEITDRHLVAPLHINATNLRDPVAPRGGSNVVDVLQRNVQAVLEQREQTGQLMFPHVNHPNFGWAITAEELMQIQGERFFEVYNGHPAVHNEGDEVHASIERMWDIVLTWRLAVLNLPPMLGLATDDSHHYHTFGVGQSNSGRGWVMVRAPHLSPEAIIRALEAGEFYATSGVLLRDFHCDGETLRVEIDSEPGVEYRIEFVGTRRGFDRTNTPIRNAAGDPLRVTHRYSEDIGEVLATASGASASYRFKGDELYVRARITSSKPMPNPYRAGETEAAWVQPFLPGQKSAYPPGSTAPPRGEKASASAVSAAPARRLIEAGSPRRPWIIAHRGYSAFAPENTVLAFDRALDAAADLVELDYHHSSDGVPIVLHDSTLDRTTDAVARWGGQKLAVSAYTTAQLTALDAGSWFNPPAPGQAVLTLEQALEHIQARGMTLVERKTGDAATLAGILQRRGLENELVVQAFDWDFLRDFRGRMPNQVLGALGPPGSRNGRRLSDDEKKLDREWLQEIASIGAQLAVWNRQVDASAVRAARELGLQVWVYTINDAATARSLIDMGVSGIITDNPALIWSVLAERESRTQTALRSERPDAPRG